MLRVNTLNASLAQKNKKPFNERIFVSLCVCNGKHEENIINKRELNRVVI